MPHPSKPANNHREGEGFAWHYKKEESFPEEIMNVASIAGLYLTMGCADQL